LGSTLLIALLIGLPAGRLALGAPEADCHSDEAGKSAHEAHEAGSAGTGYERSSSPYAVPQVTLIDRDGGEVSLAALLGTPRPVMLNFIFTSCTTICPIMTATFVAAQRELAEKGQRPLLVSVSIDPEYDTPERLAEYARRQGARQPWHFLTGNSDSIVRVQQAFGVYRGNKMNHVPVTFLRTSAGEPWTRLEGFASAADLVREYGTLLRQ
jgi:protein SCO1/2